ncbi:hypothetical protein AWC22_27735 [Mycobacterium riyadhense]|uniref:Uncharacterized protein n=1 Tax=Mycobacterium riyadhense TaxID=486698 RepID=A0A1X2BVY9_9MYCO|nr:hypothetical protein [Mycobacterium riyadhense]ORW67299.1 hypothetical protein AWC22_27735 [Mycobacterium riyadhense]
MSQQRDVSTIVTEGRLTVSITDTGQVTGTGDKTYDLIWYTEKCLENALRLETYIADAERDGDQQVADLFRKAQADSRKGAEMAKQLLAQRLL